MINKSKFSSLLWALCWPLAILAVSSESLAANETGYIVPGSGPTTYMPPWSRNSFFTNGTWWIVAEDSSRGNDVFLWKWDGGLPSTSGSAGNFSVVPEVEVADRSSGRQTIWWDEATQKLIALEMHGSPQYHEFAYDAVSDVWSILVKDEVPPLPSVSSNRLISLVVDSFGRTWFIDYESADPRAWYRDEAAGWMQGTTIDFSGGGGSGHAGLSAFTFIDGGGDRAIGVIYSDFNGWNFAWRRDQAPVDSLWNTEVATTLYGPDDHIGAMAYVPPNETTSAIVFAAKSSIDKTFVALRSPSGLWTVSDPLTSSLTKVNMILDADGEDVYVFGEERVARTKFLYIKFDLLDFSATPLQVILEETGSDRDFRGSVGTPSHPVGRATGLLAVGKGPDETWWNYLQLNDSR